MFQYYANDLDTAAEYVARIVEEISDSSSISQSFFLTSEFEQAKESLETVKLLQNRFRANLKVKPTQRRCIVFASDNFEIVQPRSAFQSIDAATLAAAVSRLL